MIVSYTVGCWKVHGKEISRSLNEFKRTLEILKNFLSLPGPGIHFFYEIKIGSNSCAGEKLQFLVISNVWWQATLAHIRLNLSSVHYYYYGVYKKAI